jgi:hypothetical protein
VKKDGENKEERDRWTEGREDEERKEGRKVGRKGSKIQE